MTLDATQIEDRIKKILPQAKIAIDDPRGDGLYLAVTVSDAAFTGVSRIDQHRMVYKAIGEETLDPPVCLSLRTVAVK